MKSKKLKIFLVSTISLTLSSNVIAQITGSSSGSPEQQFLDFFNQILFTFEAQSIAEVFLFFILPLFGFYFINKNIFEAAFENFYERIDRDNWDHRTNDELPTGVKGLSFVVAFMTVQVFGAFGTWLLIIMAFLAFAAWAISYFNLLSPGEVDVEEEIERVAGEEEEGEDALDDVEEDESEGDTEAAEHDFEHALRAFEGAEEDLIHLLDYDEHELLQVIQRAQDAVNDPDIEKANLSKLEDRIGNLQQKMTKLYRSLNEDKDNGNDNLSGSRFEQTWNDENLDGLEDIVDQINGHIVNIKRLELKSNERVRDELDDLIKETKRIKRLAKFLDRLDHDLSRLKKDERRLEQMVQQGKKQGVLDDNFVERLMGDKGKMRDLASNLDNLEQELDTVMPTLNKLINNLEGYVEIDEEVVNELIREGGRGTVKNIINLMQKVGGEVNNHYSDGGNHGYVDVLNEAAGKLDHSRVELNDMRNSIESGESKYISGRLQKLRDEYNEIVN